MKPVFKSLALAAVLGISATAVYAQVATQVTPTATRLDGAGIFGQANGATSCNTVSQTAAQDTITITPPAGQYFYMTGFYGELTFNATGVTQTLTVSTTGLNSGGGVAPFWNFGSALSTVGPGMAVSNPFTIPVKSAATGTAVTFVPSATQSANNYLCMRVTGYFAS